MRSHGGRAGARLDFSVNTNPLGPPGELYDVLRSTCRPEDLYARYPDYEYRELRRAISEFYGLDEGGVVPLNGSSEALALVTLAIKPRTYISVEPTFGDHWLAAKSLGIEVRYVVYRERGDEYVLDAQSLEALEDLCSDRSTLVIVSNPNNPTGSYVEAGSLYQALGRCGGYALVDEAYAELCSSCPLEPPEPPDNVMILRSLTKWLSVPGLRIGFLYTPSKRISSAIEAIRPPWNVNSVAECVASKLLGEHRDSMRAFIERSRTYISLERGRLLEGLKRAGVPKVYRGHANYLLAWLGTRVEEVLKGLSTRGIAVRDCRSFAGLGEGFVRVSVRRAGDNAELLEAIEMILSPSRG